MTSSIHRPQRGDDVDAWLERQRDHYAGRRAVSPLAGSRCVVCQELLNRYRECADYGLTLRPEDDERGDP